MRMTKAFAAVAFAAVAAAPTIVAADESGISFWIPGTFGSLAATPQQPGWTAAAIYYHTSVSAGADVARAHEIQIGRIPANLTATLNANTAASRRVGMRTPLSLSLPIDSPSAIRSRPVI